MRSEALYLKDLVEIGWSIVCVTATEDAPDLSRQVAEILKREYPDQE